MHGWSTGVVSDILSLTRSLGDGREKKGKPSDKKTVEETKQANKKMMRNRPKYSRLDAIKIKAAGNGSYAHILRRVTTTPDLMTLGEQVTHITHTRTDELLLEVGKNGTRTPVL